ncbi:hypothetical protein DUI87_04093 [Hirundo rustica rustica]|uniref:Uncharacterized protein n=1 Tax=Hirundo rustica rustica TaxID=333673 RepID=A0A3M0L348_HIRRU|nr:hypothetical protein DUI87_04093 [Hirundo rustica rustica]
MFKAELMREEELTETSEIRALGQSGITKNPDMIINAFSAHPFGVNRGGLGLNGAHSSYQGPSRDLSLLQGSLKKVAVVKQQPLLPTSPWEPMESSQASGQLTPKSGEQQAQLDVTCLSLAKGVVV